MNKTSLYLSWTNAAGTSLTFYPDLVVSENWTENATTTEHPVEQSANVVDNIHIELVKCEAIIFATNEPIGANNFADPGNAQSLDLEGGQTNAIGTDQQSQTLIVPIWDNQLALKGALLAAGGVIGGAVGGTVGTAIGEGVGAVLGALVQPGPVDTPTGIVAGIPAAPQITGLANTYQFSDAQDWVTQTIQLLGDLKNSGQILTVNGSKQVFSPMVIETFTYTREADTGTGAQITLGLKEVRFVQTQTVGVPLPKMPSGTVPVKKGPQNPQDGDPTQQQSVALTLANGGAAVVKNVGRLLGAP